MKTRIIITLLTAVFLVAIATPAISQNAEQLFQKGIMKEEGEGNLPEAIEIFNSIVENSDVDDALQAKALLHVGLCYEKLGKNEASRAYQKLVNNYPAQKNEVAIARERLSRLILAEEKAEQIPLQPKWSKIDIPTELSWSVALSPGGNELALVSDKKLWKLPLSSKLGSNIPGTPMQINTGDVEVEWTGLSWSRDGEWIAFNEYPNFNDSTDNQKIYIIPSEGGNPREIIENYRSARVINYHIGLSPNGKELAFSSVENNEQHIFKIPTRGGKPQKLTELNAREPVYSPDGKLIAFVEDKELGRGEGDLDVYVVPSINGEPSKIANAEKASCPVWSPDGNMVAYLDLTKEKKIFIAPVIEKSNEKNKSFYIHAPEEAEKIEFLAGWTPDNKIGALMITNEEFGLYTLPKNGGQAAKILHSTYAVQPRWSADNNTIYYTTNCTDDSLNKYRKWHLEAVPATGGKGTSIFNKSNQKIRHLPFQSGNRISNDGKTMLSSAYLKDNAINSSYNWPFTNIWKISLNDSKNKKLTDAVDNYADVSPCWSPNDNKIAFIRVKLNKYELDPYGDAAIYNIDSKGENLKLLVSEGDKWLNSLIWSHDGKMLAWMSREKGPPETKPNLLNIYDVDEEEIIKEYQVPGSNVNIEMAWSPDSKKIAFNDPEGKVIKVIDIEDGKIEDIKTGLVDVKIHHIDWSPDGKKFVFGGFKGGEKEFWFVEDFLPMEKITQNNEYEKEPEGITIKQVWKDGKVDNTGTITSDGKYLSFVDWETGDIAIRNLNTGVNERLTNEGTWDDPMHFAVNNVISPDGKKIAYSWFDEKMAEDLNIEGSYDLKIIDVDTKEISTLYKAKNNEEVYPLKWLPNSSKIIVQYFKKTDNSIDSYLSLIDTLSGKISQLMKFNSSFMATSSLSPDEKYIAYDYPNSNDDGNFDIDLLTLNGNEVSNLVNHPANDRLLGWIPGTNILLFASNRSGKNDIWSVTTNNGKISSVPQKVISNVGDQIESLGLSNDGCLYFSLWQRNFESFVVPVDENSKTLLIDKRSPLLGKNFDMEWFSDGERLVCNRLINKPKNRTFFNLCMLNVKNNKAHYLAEKISVKGPPRLSPDENFVLVFGTDEKNSTNNGEAYKVNIKTGEALIVKLGHEISEAHCLEWSRTGDSIFYVSNDKIFIHDLKTGEETVLYENEKLFKPNLRTMKKANKLVFDEQVEDNKFRLMSISLDDKSTSLIQTYNTDPGLMYKKYCFSPDEKYIYYTHTQPNPGNTLYRILAEGGKAEKLWESNDPIAGLGVHSDNKIVISTYHQELEIRKIENLKQEIEKIYAENE